MKYLIILKKNHSMTGFWIKSFICIGLFFLLLFFSIPMGLLFNEFVYNIFGFSIPFLVIPVPILIGFILTMFFSYWMFDLKNINEDND